MHNELTARQTLFPRAAVFDRRWFLSTITRSPARVFVYMNNLYSILHVRARAVGPASKTYYPGHANSPTYVRLYYLLATDPISRGKCHLMITWLRALIRGAWNSQPACACLNKVTFDHSEQSTWDHSSVRKSILRLTQKLRSIKIQCRNTRVVIHSIIRSI